ncbi:ester cyclase [Salinigranum sp.]|uniref:ester cyclase n=1 Tax=Salinigranum sp. TaxID=1966351 RepID=UPI003565DA18
MSHEEHKQAIQEFSAGVHRASDDDVGDLLVEYFHDEVEWHGPAPIDKLDGRTAVATEFWEPLLASFPDLEKNDYIRFADEFEGDEWVCATGNLVGTFEEDWLDIPATGHATWLRYGEFHRFEEGKVAETRTIVDVLDVLRQAGYRIVPSLGPEVVIPGPTTQDGILHGDRDEDASRKTMALVEGMLFDGLNSYEEEGLDGMGMDEYWHEDFMWYGPAGIGSTRGIGAFQDVHQGPFLEAFPDREVGHHDARLAEGNYCASTGWPAVVGTHLGDEWLGLPATGNDAEMRVIDVWRREGDLLAENWVFIDMIDLLDQLGVDVFERLRTNPQSVRTRLP